MSNDYEPSLESFIASQAHEADIPLSAQDLQMVTAAYKAIVPGIEALKGTEGYETSSPVVQLLKEVE